MPKAQKRGGSSKKIGRDKKYCEAYRARARREENKEKKIKRHLKKYPEDNVARMALDSIW